MDVYLVRHAEDLPASESRFADEGLSPSGREQAQALARGLLSVRFRICLASPLDRAVETARCLVEGRGIPLEIDPVLAEGGLGDLAGLSYAEARRLFPDAFRLGRSMVARLAAIGLTAPGGETRAAFLGRAAAAAQRIREEIDAAGDALLVVAHGGLLNYLLQLLLAQPVRDLVPFGFDHCGVVRLVSHTESPGFGPFPMLRFAPVTRA